MTLVLLLGGRRGLVAEGRPSRNVPSYCTDGLRLMNSVPISSATGRVRTVLSGLSIVSYSSSDRNVMAVAMFMVLLSNPGRTIVRNMKPVIEHMTIMSSVPSGLPVNSVTNVGGTSLTRNFMPGTQPARNDRTFYIKVSGMFRTISVMMLTVVIIRLNVASII